MLKDISYKLQSNIIQSFRGRNILWHLVAIGSTYVLVISGFDWWYFESTRAVWIFSILFPSAILGFFVPILLPVGLYIYGELRTSVQLRNTAAAAAQAGIIGWLVSAFYKSLTGRVQPEFMTHLSNIDVSGNFNFGFFRHGIFWGWPSSHVAVAFAMAAALITLYPRHKEIVIPTFLYTLYIGIGVSVTIHWFSDALAGAIIGTLIGIVVAQRFQNRSE